MKQLLILGAGTAGTMAANKLRPRLSADEWAITIVEIVGGLSVAAGYFVRPLVVWFSFQLLVGIYLIHGRAGWFVVGAGRNGMEFSVLLLLCFLVIALTVPAAYVLGRRR